MCIRDRKAYWLRKWEVTWKNTLVTAAILAAATAVCLIYHFISDGTVNIIMFYTIALIFIPRFTEGYVPGIDVYKRQMYRFPAHLVDPVCGSDPCAGGREGSGAWHA